MNVRKEKKLIPLGAFDVGDSGSKSANEPWPSIEGPANYRWLHFNLDDTQLPDWSEEHLPHIAAQALLQSETRPRCERYADGLILNLRGVNLNEGSDPEDMVSLRMWVTEKTIVSARKRKIRAMDAIRSRIVEGHPPTSVPLFLVELTQGLTARIETFSLHLEDQTDALEEAVWDGDVLPPEKLAKLRQAIIKLRRFINPQRDAIDVLSKLDDWIIGPKERALLREAANRTRRIVEELDATRERLSAIQDHLDANRSHALGQNSYLLSIIAAIFLPLSFLTGLFGVNLGGMPGASSELAFWLLAGLSAAGGILLFFLFKLTKWF